MKISDLSASRAKTYMTCPNRYYFTYELGMRQEAIHLSFGTLIHSVLERWFQEDANILDIYEEEWRKSDVTDFEYYQDGKDMLVDFAKKHNKSKIWTMFTEHEFNIQLKEATETYPAVTIRGFIDRVDEVDSKTIHVVDYKTSRIPLTEAEAEQDFQMSMYALAINKLYPEYDNIRLTLYYMRDGAPVTTTRTRAFLESFEPFVVNLFYQIWSDQTHKANINNYCAYCNGKHMCSAYQTLIESYPQFNVENMNFQDMLSELEHVNNSLKILQDRKSEIENVFKEEIKAKNLKTLAVGDKELYFSSGKRVNYPINLVQKVLPNNWTECISVRKSVVDQIVGKEGTLREALDAGAENYFVSPILRSRKAKKAK